MKRIGALLATLTICLSVWAEPVTTNKKSPDWQPIFGFKHPTGKAFVDRNSLQKERKGSQEYSTGAILVIENKPSTFMANGRTISYQGIVRHLIVECESRIMSPMFDFFYSVSLPTEKDIPIFLIEYEISDLSSRLNRTSPLYQTMCPVQL